MAVNDTKIHQKMKNKSLLSIYKEYYNMMRDTIIIRNICFRKY